MVLCAALVKSEDLGIENTPISSQHISRISGLHCTDSRSLGHMSYRPKQLKTSVDEAARTLCCSNKSWLIMVDLYPCPTLQRFNALSSLIKHLRYECLSSTSFMTLNNSERPSLRILRVRDCGVQSLNQFSSILVVFVDPKTAMLPPSLLLECWSMLHCSQMSQAPILHVARPKQQSSLLSSIFFLWFHGSMTVQYCPIALYNVLS